MQSLFDVKCHDWLMFLHIKYLETRRNLTNEVTTKNSGKVCCVNLIRNIVENMGGCPKPNFLFFIFYFLNAACILSGIFIADCYFPPHLLGLLP